MLTRRAQLFSLISTFLLLLITNIAQAAVVGKTIKYSINDTEFTGYISYDDSVSGKRPGIIVVHEWWGHNDYARQRADKLAKLGYNAIALDMYGDGKLAQHPSDAGKFSMAISKDLDTAEKRFMAAYHLLQQQAQTDPDKIAAIGYCFGGGVVLAMARRGVDLKAVASFHGSLGLGAPATKKIKSRVIVFNGEADPFIKADSIEAFKDEMYSAAVDYEFISYPGAKHAFTNPDADQLGAKFKIPLAYNARADKRSWQKMKVFLEETFE